MSYSYVYLAHSTYTVGTRNKLVHIIPEINAFFNVIFASHPSARIIL